ncbi:MAG: hypothetical protein LAO55_25960 [Acidobacteriia bacterium]|nr:hypothetical protein [Terriglobia bacterium]
MIFNLADTKFSVGYTNRHSAKRRFFGYQVFGQASSGIATLFSSKIKIPEGGADFSAGAHDPFHWSSSGKVVDDWILLDAGYSRSAFYVGSGPEPIDSAHRYFDRYRVVADYNTLLSGIVLVGIAAGVERRNNIQDLRQVTFETVLVPAPVGLTNSVVKTQGGFLGNYREYVAAPIYTDLLFMLPPSIKVPGFDSQIGIDGFTRSNVAAFNRYADGGVGVFLTKSGAPTKVIGGLSASWNGGKIRVALVAGFNFR